MGMRDILTTLDRGTNNNSPTTRAPSSSGPMAMRRRERPDCGSDVAIACPLSTAPLRSACQQHRDAAKVSEQSPARNQQRTTPMAHTPLQDVHLYRMDLPDHACPWGLKARQLLQDQQIPFEDHRLTTTTEVEAFKQRYGVVTTPQIFSGDQRLGGYTDLAALLQVKAESADVSYWPVIAVFATALLIDLAVSGGVMGFMGYALAMLALLKLMDIPAFATSFIKYDLVSQRIPAYARLYPGLELLVALGLLSAQAAPATGVLALVLGVAGMVSVFKAVVIDKLALNCACVGGHSKAPLGAVSFAENLMMAAMGAGLLLMVLSGSSA